MSTKSLGIGLFVIVAALAAVALGYFAYPTKQSTSFAAAGVGENGQGLLVPFEMQLKPGSGRLLVNVQDTLYEADVEESLRNAKVSAENYLGLKLSNYDIVVDLSHSQQVVSGGSAGAAFAVAIIASYLQRPMRDDVAISAALKSGKEIGPVDGIDEKIIAASEAGRRTFLIAADQPIAHEQQLQSYAKIVRVKTINEAVDYLVA